MASDMRASGSDDLRLQDEFGGADEWNTSADSSAEQKATKKRKSMDKSQLDNSQQNVREFRKRRKTVHAGHVNGKPISNQSKTESVRIPLDPLLFEPSNRPLRDGPARTYPSPTEGSPGPSDNVDDLAGLEDGAHTDHDSFDGTQGQRNAIRNISPESDDKRKALLSSQKRISSNKSHRANKTVRDEKDNHLPSHSSSPYNFTPALGSKCTDNCYRNPKDCKHRNQAPTLQTKNALIYDLPMYMRRLRVLEANPDNRQLYGPEHGPPASSVFGSDVRVLWPEETSIDLKGAQQGVTRVAWLVEHLPVIFPEWDVRFGRFTKWKLSARTVVWEMNQKWKMDVPIHQAMAALRALREGVEEGEKDEDGSLKPDAGASRSKELCEGEEEEETASRLMASFTAPLARKSKKRRRRQPRAVASTSTSLWHVEGATWEDDYDDDDDYGNYEVEVEAEEPDTEDGDFTPHEQDDAESDVEEEEKEEEEQEEEEAAADKDDNDDYNNGDENASETDIEAVYDTMMIDDHDHDHDHSDPPEEEEEQEEHPHNSKLTFLLRTYLRLGLVNTNPPSTTAARGEKDRARFPQPRNTSSSTTRKQTQIQIRLLERGISSMQSGRFGPDEEVLRWVVERALSG